MDIQKERETTNTEFSETIKLVEAVLERLTFHAFEEVFIWSNEKASKALTLCLKKTLKEFENGELVLTSSYPKLKHFSVDNVVNGLLTAIDQAQERQDNLNKEIDELNSLLTKAIPEGFVLVPKSEISDWYLDESEGLYLDEVDHWACEIEYGEVVTVGRKKIWDIQDQYVAKVYVDEDNINWELFDDEAEAQNAAAHCKAMIEAAEGK